MSYLSDRLGDAYKEGMTEEEISTALEALDNNSASTESAEIAKYKSLLSKANTEASKYKKQLREKQTAEEADAQARAEELETLRNENLELKRNSSISSKTASLLQMGYDQDLATSTATAMVDGDMDTVMLNQSKFMELQAKKIKAETMRGTPRPEVGSTGGQAIDYEKLKNEALARNDYSSASYYTRLMQSQAPND